MQGRPAPPVRIKEKNHVSQSYSNNLHQKTFLHMMLFLFPDLHSRLQEALQNLFTSIIHILLHIFSVFWSCVNECISIYVGTKHYCQKKDLALLSIRHSRNLRMYRKNITLMTPIWLLQLFYHHNLSPYEQSYIFSIKNLKRKVSMSLCSFFSLPCFRVDTGYGAGAGSGRI